MSNQVKWIKVATDIFENRKIKQIEAMPERDTILVIWFRLLTLAGKTNDNGFIYITPEVPYTDESLAAEINRPLASIRLALEIFRRFGMIEEIDGSIALTGWGEYQATEKLAEIREKNRERQKRYYYKKKQEALEAKNLTLGLTSPNALDIDIDIDIDKAASTNVSAALSARTHTRAREETKQQRGETVFRLWENNISPLTAIVGEKLKDLLDEVGEAAVKRGIERAVERGSRNFSYIAAVARREASGQSGFGETTAEREERWKREQEAVDTLSRHAARARGGTRNG